jgi:hypothetical protein
MPMSTQEQEPGEHEVREHRQVAEVAAHERVEQVGEVQPVQARHVDTQRHERMGEQAHRRAVQRPPRRAAQQPVPRRAEQLTGR